MRSIVRVFLVLAPLVLRAPLAPAGDGLALTPPMGWNSWNKFGCNVSETLIKGAADAIVASGMKDAGYRYVVIDDCWQVSRDATGRIVADPERFPSGMRAAGRLRPLEGPQARHLLGRGHDDLRRSARSRRATRSRTPARTPGGASTT